MGRTLLSKNSGEAAPVCADAEAGQTNRSPASSFRRACNDVYLGTSLIVFSVPANSPVRIPTVTQITWRAEAWSRRMARCIPAVSFSREAYRRMPCGSDCVWTGSQYADCAGRFQSAATEDGRKNTRSSDPHEPADTGCGVRCAGCSGLDRYRRLRVDL